MAVKKILLNVLGEKRYLSFLSRIFQRLHSLGLLGKEYADIFFLKKFIRKGDYCVDIGAHLGYFTLPLSRLVGDTGKVFAIEPMRAFHDTLQGLLVQKHVQNVTLYKVALGGDGEYVQMGIPDSGATKHFAHARVVEANPHLAFSGSEQVRNESGDRLFAELPRLDYIKCDVEGLEYKVFASMTKTIEKHRPILLCEFFDGGQRRQFFELIKPFGYEGYVLEAGQLVALDMDEKGGIVAQNDYFIPSKHLERMRPFIRE
ncbi:MAG TPA: FkbM family methyltransferase [Puia sp.]|nr:FkbM family methyltransferase [Puia sp.]